MDVVNSCRVGVVPNQSLIRGKVVAVRPEPGGYGQTVEVEVANAERVGDLPSFIHQVAGQRLLFYISETDLDLHPGDCIEAKATYRGGASGGQYSLLPDDIKRL